MQNSPKRSRLPRLATVVGAATLALLAGVASAAPASAATAGNVPSGPYNLTITKLANPASSGIIADGTQQDTSSLTPLAGVGYSIAPVEGVDLSTAAGWTTAADLSVNAAGQVVDGSGTTFTTGTATALSPTDDAGVTTYTTSNANVYKVTETSAPAGTEIGQPFLVTLPLPQNNTWLTDVFVYPKNTVQGAPVKTVDDSGVYGIGAPVRWTIESTVPNQTADNPFVLYSLTDDLDARLTPPATSDVAVTLAASDGTPITLPVADYTVSVTGQKVVVDFAPTGLALLTANPSAVITVKFATIVNSAGAGTIQNIANQIIQTRNQQEHGTDPIVIPSTPGDSSITWGTVEIHKVDPNGNGLAGAQFQVFTTAADANALSNPVSVNGTDTFTTAANGSVAISSLKAQNNGQGANLTYYLVETKAPSGFVISDEFSQANGGYATTVASGDNPTITVTNQQAPAIALPLTGSTGTTIFVSGGIALLAIALVLGVLRRRRQQNAATVTSNAAQQ